MGERGEKTKMEKLYHGLNGAENVTENAGNEHGKALKDVEILFQNKQIINARKLQNENVEPSVSNNFQRGFD